MGCLEWKSSIDPSRTENPGRDCLSCYRFTHWALPTYLQQPAMYSSRNRGEIRLLQLMMSLLMFSKGCVPLMIVVYEYWENQLRRPRMEESMSSKWLMKVTRGPLRYILPTSILSGVYIYISIHINANRSTYICPLSSTAAMMMPIYSILAVLLDCYLLINIENFMRRGVSAEASTRNMTYVWIGSIALVFVHL